MSDLFINSEIGRVKKIILHKPGFELDRIVPDELSEVLFQRKGKNGKYTGLTRNYIKVYKESDDDLWNTVQMLNLGEYELE